MSHLLDFLVLFQLEKMLKLPHSHRKWYFMVWRWKYFIVTYLNIFETPYCFWLLMTMNQMQFISCLRCFNPSLNNKIILIHDLTLHTYLDTQFKLIIVLSHPVNCSDYYFSPQCKVCRKVNSLKLIFVVKTIKCKCWFLFHDRRFRD